MAWVLLGDLLCLHLVSFGGILNYYFEIKAGFHTRTLNAGLGYSLRLETHSTVCGCLSACSAAGDALSGLLC